MDARLRKKRPVTLPILPDTLVNAHESYLALGRTDDARLRAYCGLFETPLGEETLANIREATNKGWVLGNDRFRQQIEALVKRQTAPRARGGDRKSAKYRERWQINQV